MKTGLVVIDMLNDFVDGVLANPAAAGIIGPVKSLIEAARSRDDWVVVYGNDAHKPGDLEFKVFGEHAVAGSAGAAVIDDNGKGMWSLEMGHPDVMYVADIDPSNPGLEIFYGIEPRQKTDAICVVDAKTDRTDTAPTTILEVVPDYL